MKKATIIIILAALFLAFAKRQTPNKENVADYLGEFALAPTPGPMSKYYFENLRKMDVKPSEIKLEKVIKEEEKYVSWLFSYTSEGKKITGMLNMPRGSTLGVPELTSRVFAGNNKKMPVVVMLRGYADEKIYFTGLGTRKAAGVLAENGFITLAPDFLGFGGSDQPSSDILAARFEKPIAVLSLLKSLENLTQADTGHVFFWAHSNGGQIALSVLEITKANIPTTLWAPVTKGFPESVFYFMPPDEELDELGREVKEKIENYCREYEEEKVSIDEYWEDIKAPLQVHQGGADQLVPQKWSDEFVATLKKLGKSITYYTYARADHNLVPDWDQVVQKDIEFFRSFL